jgi:hypothetical protein
MYLNKSFHRRTVNACVEVRVLEGMVEVFKCEKQGVRFLDRYAAMRHSPMLQR